ncbi:hypothetical protein LTR36_000553 [Oleoguttula mirabilis]|uniref:Uncharacterized protein n=1 Tax=Oleoguttula mirabilis TaxID=1507867 RepID=A0AAV9JQ89_9PEZI|nr:hypothetical protein LTR36_000553 [Oleoguttula mirabilis]
MAIAAEESSAALPARPVFMKNQRSSQALRTGVTMPSYTIQKDAPWMQPRASNAPTESSGYSDDYNESLSNPNGRDVSPLTYKASYHHPSYHAHPQQEVTDTGPQARQSRLPIFKQVRSMLHKPPPLVTPDNVRWDDYSGELSETGRAAQVKPSAYVSPYEGAFKARRRSPEHRNKAKSSRDLSPVSILQDDEIKPPPPLKLGRRSRSFTSPVSPVSPVYERAPTPLSVNERSQAVPMITTPSIRQIKRKPAPSMSTSPSENVEPQRSPSANSDWTEPPDDDEPDQQQHPTHKSHFSWTTYAASVAPGRPSMESKASSHVTQRPAQEQASSHFSWSTVNTNVNHPPRADSRPPSPPPPIPAKYTAPPAYQSSRGPPVQSILSRCRPVQRLDKEEWTPSPRNMSATGSPRSATPTSVVANSRLRANSPAVTTHSNNSAKKLPLPPELASTAPPLSHLESLLAQERDLTRQRRNVEKGISELTKIEKASPMDVPFATVRDAKKKLGEHRRRLEEVTLEEREVGIAISRARRKEGEEEGLWVRRVTG